MYKITAINAKICDQSLESTFFNKGECKKIQQLISQLPFVKDPNSSAFKPSGITYPFCTCITIHTIFRTFEGQVKLLLFSVAKDLVHT